MTRPRKCVRCGVLPRKADDEGYAFVCAPCSAEPSLQAEISMAIQADPERPRLWLRDHLGWRGGWSVKDLPVSV